MAAAVLVALGGSLPPGAWSGESAPAEPETVEDGESAGASPDAGEQAQQPEFGGSDKEPGILIRRSPAGEEYRIPDPCQPWQGGKLRAWDRTYHLVSRTLCWPGQWFDGFFADPEDVLDQSGTWVRVVGAQRWQDDDQGGREVDVDASAELPHAQQRLRLLFSNDDESEAERNRALNEPQQVGEEDETGFRTALRLALRATEKMDLDTDLGLRSELKTFLRIRGRWRRELGSGWYGRLREKVFWEDPDGWGSTTTLDFDRPLNDRLSLRFSSEAELTEENNERKRGWFLSQNAALFWQYSRRAAISFNVGANGFTDPVAAVETWYSSIRLRRNFWRPWLFYEVQPFAFWPRSDDYHGVSGVTLRLEMQFGLY